MPAFDSDLHTFKTGEVENLSLGQNGMVYESGTTAVTGSFYCIDVVTAATFTTLTMENLSGDTITGVEFAAGTKIFGRISAFTLSGGSVFAYKYAD